MDTIRWWCANVGHRGRTAKSANLIAIDRRIHALGVLTGLFIIQDLTLKEPTPWCFGSLGNTYCCSSALTEHSHTR